MTKNLTLSKVGVGFTCFEDEKLTKVHQVLLDTKLIKVSVIHLVLKFMCTFPGMKIEFVVWHVGGGGEDFGPIEKILQLEGISFQVYLFELRDPEDSRVESIPIISAKPNIKLNVIPIGLAGKSEVRDFYINKFELSSSLLQPSSLTKTDNPGFSRWGGITQKCSHGLKIQN